MTTEADKARREHFNSIVLEATSELLDLLDMFTTKYDLSVEELVYMFNVLQEGDLLCRSFAKAKIALQSQILQSQKTNDSTKDVPK